MFVLNDNSRPKKRSRDSLDSVSHHSRDEIEHTAKRKRTEGEGYTGHWPSGFWDSLSKVHLTRGALREFERRTAQEGSGRAQFPPATDTFLIASTESKPRRLKRFSRHGGPDLTHIRGVSTQRFVRLLLQYDSTNTFVVRSFPRSKGQHEPVELQPEALVRWAERLDTLEQRLIRPQL